MPDFIHPLRPLPASDSASPDALGLGGTFAAQLAHEGKTGMSGWAATNPSTRAELRQVEKGRTDVPP